MSDSGGKTGRENNEGTNDHDGELKAVSGSDDFGRSISRIAVAQICASAGFRRFQKSALEALSDVAIRYLEEIGKMARSHANFAGRTTCNVFDIVQGLEDLSSTSGFAGGSDVNRCLACSGVVQEVELYVRSAEEIPFARPVPRFPIIRNRKRTLSFAQIGETPPGKHIPSWLPTFPNRSSYSCGSVRNEQSAVPCMDSIEQARQQRNEERSPLSWPQLFDSSVMKKPSMTKMDAENANGLLECTPYLNPTLRYGEETMLPVAVPAKLANRMAVGNGLSMVDIFVPGLESGKNMLCNPDDEERRVLPKKRPTVNFRFQIDKKTLISKHGLGY